ncbi:hypothetical protein JHS3_01080 [Jeongeupia sp. HS-3]|nr:hypothetical protein JHS3_01080 [Jeongeupia sp. HS-3]
MANAIRAGYKERGIDLTDEQVNAMVQKSMGKLMKPVATSSDIQEKNTHPLISEAALSDAIKKMSGASAPLKIEERKDGFIVNGTPYVDAEGKIKSYAFDVINGDITYLVEQSKNKQSAKYIKAGSSDEAIEIASGTRENGIWSIVTTSGKKLSGEIFSPMPRGVLLGRESAVVRYTPGQGTKTSALPEGYALAPLQHGNVGATGYVLLEVASASEKKDSASGLLDSVKNLGAIFGINEKSDYALFNLDTRNIYPLNISSNGKNIHTYSQCYQKKLGINVCDQMFSFESLYSKTGKNMTHYYWLADWQKTNKGPVLVAMEGGGKATAINLSTGKKVLAYERTLGISTFDSKVNPDGSMSLRTGWIADMKDIPDVSAFISEQPELLIKTAEK